MEQIDKALELVSRYIKEHCNLNAEPTLFVVWQASVLQNFKCEIATTLPIRMCFELTQDGDQNCWYMDVYRKAENVVIPDD